MTQTKELTREDQLKKIDNAIEESISYYVMCDIYNGVTEIEKRDPSKLYEDGWLMVNKDGLLLSCPKCNAPERGSESRQG